MKKSSRSEAAKSKAKLSPPVRMAGYGRAPKKTKVEQPAAVLDLVEQPAAVLDLVEQPAAVLDQVEQPAAVPDPIAPHLDRVARHTADRILSGAAKVRLAGRVQVNLTMTPEQHARFTAAAKADNRKLSPWFVNLAMNAS